MHGAVSEIEQVPHGGTRAGGVIGGDDAEAAVWRRVDDHELQPCGIAGTTDHRGGLVEHDRPVDALIMQALERLGDVAVGAQGDHGQGVAAARGGLGHRLQHARVADRRQCRRDEADRAGAPGAQGTGGTVGAVAEFGHGGLDARSRLGVDVWAVVGDARDGLSRDTSAGGDHRHRDA